MTNELLLIASLFIYFGLCVLWYKLFGRAGVYCFVVFATIAANIEVLMLVNAFGMDMTLGNVLFATTFSCSEILSEMEGKRCAKQAVWIGIATTAMFMLTTQTWLWFVPAGGDEMSAAVRTVFANSPRIMMSSLVVYAICQLVQVGLYSAVWKLQKYGKKGLWVRSNAATLGAQAANTVLFAIFAFAGVYDTRTIAEIIIASYVIFVVTSLWDTPVLYFARRFCRRSGILLRGAEGESA
jgi:uncharacterized integral membrane protein (TIGR00697 family)